MTPGATCPVIFGLGLSTIVTTRWHLKSTLILYRGRALSPVIVRDAFIILTRMEYNPDSLRYRMFEAANDNHYNEKAAMRQRYVKQANRLGMTLRGYCQRFNVRGVV